jgi:predicted GH43/DUF377 family glycosyl hydrolase
LTLRIARKRIVSRGDIPGSDGGVYNPGAVATGEGIVLLARREIDYRFTSIVHPEIIVVDPDNLEVISRRTLLRRGYPAGSRAEDFRLLHHGGQLIAVHTLVHPDGRIRPMIAAVGERTLEPWDALELPIETMPVEKNWVLFDVDGVLHCLYRLDPLTIFARERGAWRLVRRSDNGWSSEFRGMLSNSANLVPFGDGHLGFWHSIVDGRYVQGAMTLTRDLEIGTTTGVLLDGRDASPGQKPGVLYVSALVVRDGRVLAFYGEGDAHCGAASIDATALAEELARHPFAIREPVTVRLAPASMGELFHAMVALDDMTRRGPPRPLWVDVPPPLHEAVKRFAIRGLALRDLAGRPCDYDVGSLCTATPARPRARRS